jgi:sigma-E factor negative regulatory protein RseA
MIEQEQTSQLSALFDGELPPQQAEMVIRRALRDPAMRASWERYSLIGACLRGEPINRHNSIADRVQASLAAERELNVTSLPVRHAGSRATAGARSFLASRGALGGAIAAGVAAVSLLLVRAVVPEAGGAASPGALMAQAPSGYTTPGENSPAARPRMIDASLGHYLVAHSEEAASTLRFSYDAAPVGVELTEDQISAERW